MSAIESPALKSWKIPAVGMPVPSMTGFPNAIVGSTTIVFGAAGRRSLVMNGCSRAMPDVGLFSTRSKIVEHSDERGLIDLRQIQERRIPIAREEFGAARFSDMSRLARSIENREVS